MDDSCGNSDEAGKPTSVPVPTCPAPRSRLRRWLKWLLGLVLGFAVLVILADAWRRHTVERIRQWEQQLESARNAEQIDEQKRLLRVLIDYQESLFGVWEEEALRNTAALAAILVREKAAEEAVPLLRRVLQGHERLYGLDDRRTLTSARRLGHALTEIDETEEAESLLRRALIGRERVLGQNPPTLYKQRRNWPSC